MTETDQPYKPPEPVMVRFPDARVEGVTNPFEFAFAPASSAMNLTCTFCGCLVDVRYWRSHRERCTP